MVSGHLFRREDEVLSCRLGFVICGMFQWVAPAGNEQEELDESRPRFPFGGFWL